MANNRSIYYYGSVWDKNRRIRQNIDAGKRVQKDISKATKEDTIKALELLFPAKDYVNNEGMTIVNRQTWKYFSDLNINPEPIEKALGQDNMVNFFKVIANKNQDANKLLKITINNLRNISISKQETAAVESLGSYKRAMSYFNNNVKNKGKLFAWDLETIGGKDINGIWKPNGITEFSLQAYNYDTKSIDKTNVFLGMNPDMANKLKNQIAEAIRNNTIDQQEDLKVTAMRMAKYGSDTFKKEYDTTKGYYIVKSFPTEDIKNWKDINQINRGFQHFIEAYTDSRILEQEKIEGIRPDQKAIVMAIKGLKESLDKNEGFLLGQNHLSHDTPIMNIELLNWAKANPKIAELLGNDVSFNIDSNKTLDLLGAMQMYSGHYGISKMYGGVDISQVDKFRGQEYIVQNFLPNWFKNNNLQPHMASDDVTALLGLATVKSEVKGIDVPFLEYLDQGLTQLKDTETNIIPGRHILRAKKGINGDWSGKDFFNFAQSKSTGEIYTAKNFVIGTDGIAKHKNYSAGFGINKGRLYNVLSIDRFDFNEETRSMLSEIAPNFSGDHFYRVQLGLDIPDEYKGYRIDDLVQNLVFRSQKEMEAFISGEFDIAAERDKNGSIKIADDMVRYFDRRKVRADKRNKTKFEMLDPNLRVTPKNRQARKESWIRNDQVLYERERKAQAERLLVSRADNAIFRDKSLKRAKQIIDIEDQLLNEGIISDYKSINSRLIIDLMSERIAKGQQPLSLNNEQIMTARNIINKTLQVNSYKNEKILASTINNIAIGMDMQRPYKELVRSVINTLELQNNWEDQSEGYKQAIYSQVMQRYKQNIADELYGNIEKQNRSVLGNKKLETSYAELKDTFELNLKSLIKDKKRIIQIDASHPEELTDVLKLDLGDKNIQYNLLNKVTAAIYGDKYKKDNAHQLDAMVQLVDLLSKDTQFRKNKISFNTAFNRDETGNIIGVHPYEIAEDIVSKMKLLKNKNATNGIINSKHAYMKAFEGDKAFQAMLNNKDTIAKKLPGIIDDVVKNYKYIDIATKDNKIEYNMFNSIAKDIVSKYYIPQLKDFKQSAGFNETTEKLYQFTKEDLIQHTTNVLQSYSKIDGTKIHIYKDKIVAIRGNDIFDLDQYIPKVTLSNNGVLDVRIGGMRNQLYSVLNFSKDKNSIKGDVVSSLHPLLVGGRSITRTAATKTKHEGYKEAIDYLNYTFSKRLRIIREQPTINGYGGNDIDINNSVDTSNIKNILLDLFDENSSFRNILEQQFPDRNLIETIREDIKYYDTIDKLDAETARDIMKNIPYLIDAIKAGGHISDDFDFMTTNLISGGQEKKVREGVFMRGYRASNSVFGTFDNTQRPPITQSGNVYDLRVKDLKPEHVGNIITNDFMNKRNMKELESIGQVTSDTMMHITYIDTNSLNILIDNNFKEILNDNTIEANTKKQLIKSYNFVRSNINTFEQERAINAKVFEERFGFRTNQTQKLSIGNDLKAVMDNLSGDAYERQKDSIFNYIGSFTKTDDGIIYEPSHGKLVKRGESILKWKGFADTDNDFASKMSNGVFNFSFFDPSGNKLRADEINDLIAKHIDAFNEVNDNDQYQMFNILRSVLEDNYGIKGQYAIEDVTAKGYPKTMTSGAEKGMAKALYTPYGEKASTKTFFEQMNAWDMVKSSGVITDEALEAIYYSDEDKALRILKSLGFNSLTEFKTSLAEERYGASNFLFDTIFKGKADLLANDNIAGHENIGELYQGSLSKAINSLTKQYQLEGRTNAQSEAIDYIANLINNENPFMLTMDLQTNKTTPIKVSNKNNALNIDNSFISTTKEVSMFDNEQFTSLLNKIDTQLTNLDEADRLIAHDVYVLNDDGYYDLVKSFSGSVITTNRDIQVRNKMTGEIVDIKNAKTIAGSNTYEPVKFVKDSEVQSGVTEEYFSLKQKSRNLKFDEQDILNEIRVRQKDQRLARSEAVAKGLPASSVKKDPYLDTLYRSLDNVRREKQEIDEAIMAYSSAVKTMKMGDTELAVLEKVSLSTAHASKINDLIANGELHADAFTDSIAFAGNVSLEDGTLFFDPELFDKRFFKSITDDIKAKQFYREDYENELTEDMLRVKSHLKPIYKEVHDRYKTKLGEDTAEQLYMAKMGDLANRFNKNEKIVENIGGLASDRDYLVNKANFIEKNILDANFDLEHISNKHLMIDLGEEFESDRYIAVPGLGSVLKDKDVRYEAQIQLRSLQNIIGNMYDLYGDENQQEQYFKLKALADEKRNNIVNLIDNQMYGKHGVLQEASKIEMDAASYRLKASGIVSNNLDPKFIQEAKNIGFDLTEHAEYTEKAIINGKTIADWEREGVFYDYKFMSREQFEKMGYFKPETLERYGFKGPDAIEQMEEFLKTYGTYDVTDRYPNIKNDSLAVARVFLGEGLSTNQTKVSIPLMLGANGDQDGDLYSSFLIKYKNTHGLTIDGGLYEKRKLDLLNSGLSKEEIATTLKDEGYGAFIDLEQGMILQATEFKGRPWHEEALKKLKKDRLRVQNMYNAENRVAVPGGESILGRVALNNLEKVPSLDEFNNIENEANNLLKTAKDILIKTGKDDGRFDEDIRSGISPTRLDDALTVIKNAMDNTKIDTSNITDDMFKKFEATAIKRVNIDRYATEVMAKTGLPTTGTINLALSAVRLADFQASTNAADLAFSNYVWSILGEPEQLAISSKKVDGSSIYDDTRVKDVVKAVNDIFHNPNNKNGMKIDKKLVKGLTDWLDTYGDDIFETSYKKFGDYILDDNIIQELNGITNEKQRLAQGTKYMRDYFADHIVKMTGNDMAMSYLSAMESVGRNGHNASRMIYNGSVGAAAAEGNSMTARVLGAIGYSDDTRARLYREQRAQEEIRNLEKQASQRAKDKLVNTKSANAKMAEDIAETSIKAAQKVTGNGLGKLGMLAIGTGIGLMVGGYASGNPLNDKSAEQVNKENQQQPTQVMSIPEFMDKDSGYVTGNSQQGYIINLKADTRKGRKYMEKIMSKAAEASVGGAVNVNMNIRNMSSKGITDKDIEKYINQYL